MLHLSTAAILMIEGAILLNLLTRTLALVGYVRHAD